MSFYSSMDAVDVQNRAAITDMTESEIPKKFHQIWFQGQARMPARYLAYQKALKDLHPGYEYEFWDEPRIAHLLQRRYPTFYQLWCSLPFMIQKIDAAKLFILHRYGGIYMDLDMEPIRSIEPLLTRPLVM